MSVALYLDEHVPLAVAQGLRLRGVDVLTVQDDDRKGIADHLLLKPNFDEALPWLDPSNHDDRIIASILQVQVLAPSANVMLVTSDVNLQNKADAAMLLCAETPLKVGGAQ